MNGVEILSQTNIYETEVYWWFIPAFAGVGLLIGLIISIPQWTDLGFDVSDILVVAMLVLLCAMMGAVFTKFSEHEIEVVDYIEYKVTIDDSVSMNEFLDKYEILDQEGKIYTVKERE